MSDARKQPTLHDVARLSGLSLATTARALGDYGKIAPSSRDRALAAAKELGYRPNKLARSMRSGKTETIGVICADLSTPFFAEAVRGVTDAARQRGYEVIIVNTDEDSQTEQTATVLLRDRLADGVIVAPADVCRVEHIAELDAQGTAVVLFDRSSSLLDLDAIVVDDVQAMATAVDHLIEHGHTKIGIVVELRLESEADWTFLLDQEHVIDRRALNPGARRLLGYLLAHRNAGIDIVPEYVARSGATSGSAAKTAAERLLTSSDVTALVAVDGATSIGAFGAVKSLGVAVPEKLSFIAFDNLDWTSLVTPPLTVIEQPVSQIGEMAASILIDRIEGVQLEPAGDHVLRTRLIRRSSVARPQTRTRRR